MLLRQKAFTRNLEFAGSFVTKVGGEFCSTATGVVENRVGGETTPAAHFLIQIFGDFSAQLLIEILVRAV